MCIASESKQASSLSKTITKTQIEIVFKMEMHQQVELNTIFQRAEVRTESFVSRQDIIVHTANFVTPVMPAFLEMSNTLILSFK